MTWWAYIVIAAFVTMALVVEYYERRELRRMKLYRDAERAAKIRVEQNDQAFENRKQGLKASGFRGADERIKIIIDPEQVIGDPEEMSKRISKAIKKASKDRDRIIIKFPELYPCDFYRDTDGAPVLKPEKFKKIFSPKKGA